MESLDKRSLMALSIAQTFVSLIFFVLGMVDGFVIRFGYASLLYTPCWITVLALPVGLIGLTLARSRRPSPILINAIWSVSVACILYSAMTISMYHHWGMEMLLFYKHLTAGSFSSLDSLSSSPFVKKDAKLEFTEEEKAALAVFTLIIIFCIIEIILAAAIIKISGCQTPQTAQTPQSPQMYYMYPGMHIQTGQDGSQLGRTTTGVYESSADDEPLCTL